MNPTSMPDANVSNIYSQYIYEYPRAVCRVPSAVRAECMHTMHSQISVLAYNF